MAARRLQKSSDLGNEIVFGCFTERSDSVLKASTVTSCLRSKLENKERISWLAN